MKQENTCPTCKGPRRALAENPSFPFCSGRCKLADLDNWLSGRYTLAGEPVSEDDDESNNLH